MFTEFKISFVRNGPLMTDYLFCSILLLSFSHHWIPPNRVPTPWPALQPRSPPALAKGPRHWISLFRDPPSPLNMGPHCTGTPASDIWWPRLETCSNLFTWDNPRCWHLMANEVWGKAIFSEVCVKNSVHRGGLSHCMLGYPAGSRPPPPAVHAGRYGKQAGGTHPTGM